MPTVHHTPEHERLEAARTGEVPWKAWGPYLSERQWGTVREDYSGGGDAWDYFPHDHARSRAYRWGEDGIAGISDDKQRLCLALALWNGQDPILKERMFGLTNGEGNHGEDVKEYWFYLDSTPTHSYMKCLYKYPQRAYPYDDLIRTNGGAVEERPGVRTAGHRDLRRRGATSTSRDRIREGLPRRHRDARWTAHNRGPEAATLHLLPTLWFRNTWSWGGSGSSRRRSPRGTAPPASTPRWRRTRTSASGGSQADASAELLFCDNDTNNVRLFGSTSESAYPKDAINDFVVDGRRRPSTPIGTEPRSPPITCSRSPPAARRRSPCA